MALSRHHAAAARPLSVQEIVEQAQDFEYGSSRPLKAWLRAAQMLVTEASMCEQDGNIQLAYLYLYRHAELVLGKLPTHPDYKSPNLKADLILAQKAVKTNLSKLESWKSTINQQHQRYLASQERRSEELRLVDEERRRDHQDSGEIGQQNPSLIDGNIEDSTQVINADEYRQLAVDLAQREQERRIAGRRSQQQAGNRSQRQLVNIDSTDRALAKAQKSLHEQSLSRSQHGNVTDRSTHDSYRYPSVPAREESMPWNSIQPLGAHARPPTLPSKQPFASQAPTIPPKTTPATAPSQPANGPEPPSKYTFAPAAYTESGAPLRTVMLPPSLRTEFLNLAHSNTSRNLETCGILCGTLISNALFISHLILPDQNATSDTCDTTEAGDNALFEFCDAHGLLVCGWIHTHPTQSCFLSSRDLHTSSGYQVMLPEAIAIVCAPRHLPDWGIFRLTDPPGLGALLKCEQKGLFHPHAESILYTDALRPGHVVEGPGLKFEVVDLRES